MTKKYSKITVNKTEEQLIINDSIITLGKDRQFGKKNFQMNEVVIPFGKKNGIGVG